jgi:hypothetical protein
MAFKTMVSRSRGMRGSKARVRNPACCTQGKWNSFIQFAGSLIETAVTVATAFLEMAVEAGGGSFAGFDFISITKRLTALLRAGVLLTAEEILAVYQNAAEVSGRGNQSSRNK